MCPQAKPEHPSAPAAVQPGAHPAVSRQPERRSWGSYWEGWAVADRLGRGPSGEQPDVSVGKGIPCGGRLHLRYGLPGGCDESLIKIATPPPFYAKEYNPLFLYVSF
jgi:hypothetical protein